MYDYLDDSVVNLIKLSTRSSTHLSRYYNSDDKIIRIEDATILVTSRSMSSVIRCCAHICGSKVRFKYGKNYAPTQATIIGREKAIRDTFDTFNLTMGTLTEAKSSSFTEGYVKELQKLSRLIMQGKHFPDMYSRKFFLRTRKEIRAELIEFLLLTEPDNVISTN